MSHASTHVRGLYWLARDTFQQSISSSIFWLMLVVSGLCIAVCLSVDVVGTAQLKRENEQPSFLPRNDPQSDPEKAAAQGVDVVTGEVTIAFGAITVPVSRDAYDAVRYIQLILAGLIADTAGVLLTLMWTAAFLPGFLEPRAVSVLLAKPVSRGYLLIGKFLGVLAFVLFQATVFVGGTWLALGLRTEIWDASYLLCIPLLLLHFSIFFSFSVLLAVVTRSTMVSILGSMTFWFVCWGMNFGRHLLVASPDLGPELTYGLGWVVEVGYWIMPKPADLTMILFQALDASNFFASLSVTQAAHEQFVFTPILSVGSSLAFMVVVLYASFQQFAATDY